MPVSPFLAALRLATRDLHDSLEREADVEAALRDADRRADAVSRFYDFHRAVEAAVAPWTEAVAALGFSHASRSAFIDRDLEALTGTHVSSWPGSSRPSIRPGVGRDYEQTPEFLDSRHEAGNDDDGGETGPVQTLGQALGWIYVAEGSMLGGRVMLKAMRRDGIAIDGLGFLDPHGDETGPRWQTFIRALEVAGERGLADMKDVVTGGRDAFGLAGRLLVPPREMESAA